MDRTAAAQDLAAIRGLMEESQNFLYGTWRHQLVWGLLTAGGILGTYGLVTRRAGGTPYLVLWAVVLAAGWIFSLRQGRPSGPVANAAGRAYGGIWLGLGVTLTLLGTAALWSGALPPESLPGVLAVVMGAGYFASGFLAGLGWLSGVGVAWWTGGVILLFQRGPAALLALAVMMVVLEVGPALKLRRQEAASVRRPA